MKISLFFSLFAIAALALFVVWAKHEISRRDTSITVSESKQNYLFEASYDAAKTAEVEYYINQHIRPDQLGGSENDYIDVNTRLDDDTHFYIRESPGRLRIKLDKGENTTASCNRIRNMCNGIKSLLADKGPHGLPKDIN